MNAKKTSKHTSPFRLGKNQKLATNGIEVVIFAVGSEKLAQEFVNFLNLKYVQE